MCFQGFIVSTADDSGSVHLVPDQITCAVEIGSGRVGRQNFKFSMRFSRPAQRSQKEPCLRFPAVGLAEPIVIFRLIGSQLDGALQTGHRPGEFPELVITLPEQ